MSVNLNMDCLRSFVAAVELGSFSRAADHVGRTGPAVSLQMDRLEKQIGITLFEKAGRKNVVSVAGTEFYEHARAILDQNDAALQLAQKAKVSGVVKLGVVQDLAEDFLPQALNTFSKQFENIRIEVLVERSRVMLDLLERGELDQVVAFDHKTTARSVKLKSSEMIWLGASGCRLPLTKPVPIVLVEGPCLFRKAAFSGLADAGLSWDIKLTSPSLACVLAAAEAGVGLAVRTKDTLRKKRAMLDRQPELPKLPDIDLHLYNRPKASNPAVSELSKYWVNKLRNGG